MGVPSKIRYLLARTLPNGSVKYYARVRVPKELLRFYTPAKEVKVSLHTSDRKEALVRLHEAVSEIRFEFELKRKQSGAEFSSSVDVTTMRRIVRRYFAKIHENMELDNTEDIEGYELGELIDEVEEEANSLRTLDETWLGHIQSTVDELLVENFIQLEVMSKEYWVMCQFVRRAMLEVKLRFLAALKGYSGRKFDALFDGVETDIDAAIDADHEEISIHRFIELFNSAQGQSKSAKKQLEYGMVYQLIKDHWGERLPLREVRRTHVRAIKETLEKLPPNSTKKFPNMSTLEIAAYADTNNLIPLSPSTANGYLQKISTMFNWGIQEEYIEHNPATKMAVNAVVEDKKAARLPFDDQQLKKIFSAEHFSKETAPSGNEEKFWIPLIALFSGMRMNEICQLECVDIIEEDKVYCFCIQDGSASGDKKFKSAASKRIVPIHSELLRIGILDYWRNCEREGRLRLFPNLKKDSRGYYSGNFQKWFGRYLAECDAKAPKTSFHSFRHRFRDALREVDVSVEAVESICGWTGRGMQYQYGSNYGARVLAKHIEKVKYQNLDLSHLY